MRAEAVVVDNNDPTQKGRIKVRCEALLQSGESLTEWIPPRLPLAGSTGVLFVVPEIGDEVEISFSGSESDGDIDGDSFLTDPNFSYSASIVGQDFELPALLAASYPNRLGFSFEDSTAFILDRSASRALLVASTINLGTAEASHPVTLADLLRPILSSLFTAVKSAFDGHTHTAPGGAGGPTTPPLVPMTLDTSGLEGDTWQSSRVMASGQGE